jgi:hypothetical protein
MIGRSTIAWPDWNRATLKGHKCPCAGCTGILMLKRFDDYEISGRRIVPVAYVNVCDACGEPVVTETEFQRLLLVASQVLAEATP